MTSAQFHIPALRGEWKRDCVAAHSAPPPWIDELPVSCSELGPGWPSSSRGRRRKAFRQKDKDTRDTGKGENFKWIRVERTNQK